MRLRICFLALAIASTGDATSILGDLLRPILSPVNVLLDVVSSERRALTRLLNDELTHIAEEIGSLASSLLLPLHDIERQARGSDSSCARRTLQAIDAFATSLAALDRCQYEERVAELRDQQNRLFDLEEDRLQQQRDDCLLDVDVAECVAGLLHAVHLIVGELVATLTNVLHGLTMDSYACLRNESAHLRAWSSEIQGDWRRC